MNPKFSIVTVTLNSEKYLEQTIRSIASQTYRDFEHIVIDGGSTDKTIDLIEKYRSDIAFFISEPDNGIADAMNKGLSHARGEYILFVHSDDYLIDPTILERIVPHLADRLDIYIFQVKFVAKTKNCISKNRPLDWRTNFKMGSCHQGHVCSMDLFRKLGTFDTSFKIDMDYDFVLRAHRSGATSRSIDMPIAVMRLEGISSRLDWAGLRKRFLEERRAHTKNCPNIWFRATYLLYWLLYSSYLYAVRRNKPEP